MSVLIWSSLILPTSGVFLKRFLTHSYLANVVVGHKIFFLNYHKMAGFNTIISRLISIGQLEPNFNLEIKTNCT